MGTRILKQIDSNGDIGAIYETILRELERNGYAKEKGEWPKDMTLKRGNRGMLAKNMMEAKTTLNLSFKQNGPTVHVFFEFNIGVPKTFVDQSFYEDEITRIKHEIIEPTREVSQKTCDVCLNVIEVGDSFCKSCGRSSKPDHVEDEKQGLVTFDKNRIPFGVKLVDDTLYGGLQKNSVVLITSPALEEKTILINRFIESGLDDSEIVVNVSDGTKQNPELTKNNKYFQIICNNQTSEQSNSNSIILKDAERLTEVSMSLTTTLNNVAKMDPSTNHKRLVLDIVSDVLLTNKSVNTRKWLRETISKFKSKNYTVLAILNPLMHPAEETQALFDLFEGKIEISEREENGEDKITFKVKRLDGVKYSSRAIELVREDLLIKPEIKE